MSPAASSELLREYSLAAPAAAAVLEEPLSPFVTMQQPSDTGAPSDWRVHSKDSQRFDPGTLRRIPSGQPEHFKPLDSPVDFANTALQRPAVPCRNSADGQRIQGAGGQQQSFGAPAAVPFLPLSSGWLSSGSFNSVSGGVEAAVERELQLAQVAQRWDQQPPPQQQQRDQGLLQAQHKQQLPFAQQLLQEQRADQQQRWQQQQQAPQPGSTGILAGLLHQQPSSGIKHVHGRLHQLLSWGASSLQLPHAGRRQAAQASKAGSPANCMQQQEAACPQNLPTAGIVCLQHHRQHGVPLQQTQQQQKCVGTAVLVSPPVGTPGSPLSMSPTCSGVSRGSSVASRSSSVGWCNLRLSEDVQRGQTPAAAALTAAVSSRSCPSSPAAAAAASKLLSVPASGGGGAAAGSQLVCMMSVAPQQGSIMQDPTPAAAAAAPSQQQPLAHMSRLRSSLRGCRSRQHRHCEQGSQQPHPCRLSRRQSSVFRRSLGRSSFGSPLEANSSLRTALVHLEQAASSHTNRLMERINTGLARLTSLTQAEGILRLPVGREVLRDWEYGPEIGKGASCVTRLVLSRATGCPAACKTIAKSGIFRSAAVKVALLGVQRELAIMQYTSGHPHVVQLRGVYEDARALHLVMEWCAGGCLEQLAVRAPHGRLGEAAAAAVAKAVLEVLVHIHEKGVVHRDIKPDNILLTRCIDDPQQLSVDAVKVADFGISLPITPGKPLTELAGTLEYMAPEVLQRNYGAAADVWSTGVMLHELISGLLPFTGNSTEQMLRCILKTEVDLSGPAWEGVSDDAKQIVGLMLQKHPADRPTARQLLDTFSAWLELGSL